MSDVLHHLSRVPTSDGFPACPHCTGNMQLYGVEQHPQLPETDLKTYVCDRCGAVEALPAPWPPAPTTLDS
jgi:hypothetical protein